jgi:hypothetical protein
MRIIFLFLLVVSITSFILQAQNNPHRIVISENHHFLQYKNGEPFFWLGDIGWFLFSKLTREEVKVYLKNRKEKGFNVIQCMVIPSIPLSNIYDDSAFINAELSLQHGSTMNHGWILICFNLDTGVTTKRRVMENIIILEKIIIAMF